MRRLRTPWIAPTLLMPTVLALAGCGGSAVEQSGTPDAGTVVVDGSSTVFRISKAAQEAYSQGQARRQRRRRQPRHRRRLQPLPPGRGRHRRRLAAGQARRGGEGQGAGDRVDPVPRRLRRDHRRRQPEERLRQVARPSSSSRRSGRPRARSRPGRTSIRPGPTARSSSTAPTTTRGRSSSSPRRSSARPRASARTCRPAPTTTSWSSGVAGDPDGLGYFGYAYYAANTGQAPRGRRSRTAPTPKPVDARAPRRSSTRRTPRSRGRCTST